MNSFAYVSNNPQNKTDPHGLYEIDVHYYLTYYLARKTGCFSDEQARLIAEWTLRSDENDNMKPGLAHVQRNVDFHAFGTHAQNAVRMAQLWGKAHSGAGSLSTVGTLMHFLQDSYSHFDFAGNEYFGQASGGYSVDHTNANPGKAMEMARATWDALNEYGRQKGLCCKRQDPDWGRVGAFNAIGYDLSTKEGRRKDFTQEISNEQLRLKILILDVPWRSPNGRSRP